MANPTAETAPMGDPAALLEALRCVVGRAHVLVTPSAQRRFLRGYRYGGGAAAAVVRPGSLVEYWRVLEVCVAAEVVIISQAANTGLTGGSTPFATDYDRPVVVINTMRLKGLHLIADATQVVALPGTTLNELEIALDPHGREPHSVIGSSCLGASVIGGVCNNSGGALIRRGPSYTELALYAQRDADGRLVLVNALGIALGNEPEEMLARLDAGRFADVDIRQGGVASDRDYEAHVRAIGEETPARFNADPRKLHGASGSAGKLAVFAVRLDTFRKEQGTTVLYVGTNDAAALQAIRRQLLSSPLPLPIAAEYIHREAFEIAETYGKDTYLLVKWLGTRRLPAFFALKSRLDALFERLPLLPANPADRVLQGLSRLLPAHLPARLRDYRERFEHHLMIKVSAEALEETQSLIGDALAGRDGASFACDAAEGAAAFLHRFATAGAAVRYSIIHGRETGGLVALDVALPRNSLDWFETLPAETAEKTLKRLYYGHFFCHVFHQDYVLAPGQDWLAVEHELLALLAARGARYPAEHNFGHLYAAPAEVLAHYQALDPCNCFNPGIGQASPRLRWKGEARLPTSEEATSS
ncbi:D-lactate dehydrogenase [Rhizobium sp. YIM 134829]|uniref:D-lactate dehydrogenase n=1 Tax=Rhizobium sp. YIM 134829 TaxID=3390453 RepID=UPI00397C69E9